MGCRCAERRIAIRRAAAAAIKGDGRGVTVNAGFVGRTMVRDARTAARDLAGRRLAALSGVKR